MSEFFGARRTYRKKIPGNVGLISHQEKGRTKKEEVPNDRNERNGKRENAEKHLSGVERGVERVGRGWQEAVLLEWCKSLFLFALVFRSSLVCNVLP